MRRLNVNILGFLPVLLVAGQVHGQATINTNQSVTHVAGPQTPGVEVTEAGVVDGFNFAQTNVACNIAQPGCPVGTFSHVDAFNPVGNPDVPVPGVPGLSYFYAARAFGNSPGVPAKASVTANIFGVPSNVPPTGEEIFFDANSTQQFSIDYNGPLPPPQSVPVDVGFELLSEVDGDGNNVSPTGGDAGGSYSALYITEPSTYNPATSTEFMPWEAFVSSGPLYGESDGIDNALANGVATLNVNTLYAVDIGTSDTLYLAPSGATNGTSLDYTFDSDSDPSLTIDPTWLAANPEYAGDLTISQTFQNSTGVPEPASWALFGAGLFGMLFAARCRPRSFSR